MCLNVKLFHHEKTGTHKTKKRKSMSDLTNDTKKSVKFTTPSNTTLLTDTSYHTVTAVQWTNKLCIPIELILDILHFSFALLKYCYPLLCLFYIFLMCLYPIFSLSLLPYDCSSSFPLSNVHITLHIYKKTSNLLYLYSGLPLISHSSFLKISVELIKCESSLYVLLNYPSQKQVN